jgi:membrane fusion protein (multidrug efflux system)
MKVTPIPAIALALFCLSLAACTTHKEEHHEEAHKIVVTSPVRKDVISTQPYVCQIHSCQHIEVRALEGGYLEKICVKEGQAVKKGELMYKILPTLYQAKQDSEQAEVQRMQIEFENAESLLNKGYVSPPEIALKRADLSKAKAKLALANAELSFTSVVAPFDGIVDRQRFQLGSLIQEGDVLTTCSDNSMMWVYFNVPEGRYLEYMADRKANKGEVKVELVLANGNKFDQIGKIAAIEADFNNQTGNVPFRADFPNPDLLLRHCQTGTVVISRVQNDSIVIPQRATFEVLAKRYVYVVDEDNLAHQREIEIKNELDDLFVIDKGIDVNDKIVLEGTREVRDGEKLRFEDVKPEQVVANLKYHAE